MSNLKQCGLALTMYANDYGYYPPNFNGYLQMRMRFDTMKFLDQHYLENPRIAFCPSNRDLQYNNGVTSVYPLGSTTWNYTYIGYFYAGRFNRSGVTPAFLGPSKPYKKSMEQTLLTFF
ncbi:unnamed protein product [marine sediment metagenome]|uniref:Uncharacterized protein n=1 Tax=marine sediment metagenome TaxID=412755 RepID=X1KD24_9ZZZZ